MSMEVDVLRRSKQASTSSDSTDTSEDEGQLSEYDSDEVSEGGTYKLKLSTAEVTRCFTQMKCRNAGPIRKTSTSTWSRTISASCAAYKLFKIKRWNLTNESLIFDPLQLHPGMLNLKPSGLLWDHDNEDQSDVNEVCIKALSVDGLIYKSIKASQRQIVMDNLRKFDELLEDINWPTVTDLPEVKVILAKANQSLPERCHEPFHRFIFALHKALFLTEERRVCREMVFKNLFGKLFSCIAACLGEKTINCDISIDGTLLDKLEVQFPFDELCRVLRVSSVPDLIIYENIDAISQLKRGIAVVEVKGKEGDKVIHSDDEDEDLPRTKLGVVDEDSEDSEEELPEVEKAKFKKHKEMTKMKKMTRLYMRRFLPQIIGEMICFSETTGISPMKHSDHGFCFGIAVIGFDVHFVSLVTSNGATVISTLSRSDLFSHVFVTRPLNILNKTDRRIVIKTLAAACCMKKPVSLRPSYKDS